MRVHVIHGPNLNLLGIRDPAIYGTLTLDELNARIADLAAELKVEVEFFQFNSEGALIDCIHASRERAQGLIVNAGAYAHSSIAIADAITSVGLPAVEAHLSNIYAREAYRRISVIAPVCIGSVVGLGPNAYLLALRGLVAHLYP
ncbi:MAG: type II 3-dehydroquinate dehydratase [Candidatus Eremiobacteraeota bacterium]|nr:type II 3-dehydroquinate dehydratase [Candidatus Eremiobacteraeota bacterium]